MHENKNRGDRSHCNAWPFLLGLGLLAFSSGTAEAVATNVWSSNGPASSAVHALAFRGTALSGTILAGTNGAGIYRSTNAGSTWTTSNTGIPADAKINALLGSGSEFLAATRGTGLFTSSDDGITWSGVSDLSTDGNVTAMVANGTGLYASIEGGGVFRRDNTGTWTDVSGNLANLNIRSLTAIPPGEPPAALIVGTTADGIYRGTYNLSAWTWGKAGGIDGKTVLSLAFDSGSPSTVYAGTFGSGIYKSTDGGATWTVPLNSGLPASATVTSLQFLAPTLYAETDSGLFTSTNGAISWTAVKSGVTATSLAFAPSATKMLLGTTAGLLATSDSGSTWTAVPGTITYATDIRATAVDPANSSFIYAGGSGSGAFKSLNAATTWSIVNSGLGNVTVNALLPRGATLYAATSSGMYRTTSGGATWDQINSGLPSVDVRSAAIDTITSTLYAATGSGVFKTAESPIAWTAAGGATLTNPDVSAIAVDSSSSTAVIYAGTGSGMFKSTDGGATWTSFNSGLTNPPIIRSLAVDSNTPARVYAATPGGLFQYNPLGTASWNRVSSGFTDVMSVAVGAAPFFIVAGTNGSGTYLSSNGTTTWLPLTAGLPTSPVVQSLAIDSGVPTKVYAGIAGNGVSAVTVSPTISLGGTTSLNYGTVFKGSATSKTITIGNTGSIPLSVSDLSFTGSTMFSAAAGTCANLPVPGTPLVIQPGQNCILDITYAPTATGPHAATLSMVSDDVNAPTTAVALQGSAITLAATITAPGPGVYLYGSNATISGTAAASGTTLSRVEIAVNNGPFTTVTGTTAWTYTLPIPTDGTFTLKVRAFDATGQFVSTPNCSNNSPPFDCISVIVNNTLPVSTITAPADGAILTAVLPITGTAVDAGAGVKKVDVAISADGGATWTTYPASTTNNWTNWTVSTWSAPASGTYRIKATATDNDNKVEALPTSISIILDGIPPASAITAPAAGATITGTSYTIRGTASDTGGSGLKRVDVSFDGGATWSAATGLLNWIYTLTIPAGTHEAYTIVSRATDNAGNPETLLPPVTVNVDNTPPTSTIAQPPAYLTGTSYTFNISATDPGLGVQKVQVSVNNGTWVDAIPGATDWTYTWALPADGSYSIRSKAIDLAGNEQVTPYQRTVVVDNDPPAISLVKPADNEAINTDTYTVMMNATDAGAGVQKVEISIGGVSYPSVYDSASATWRYAWSITSGETTYSLFAKATDNNGRTQTTTPITVMADRTAPISAITWPLSGALVNGSTFTIMGTASDPPTTAGPGSGIAAVQISFDGTVWLPAATTDNWAHWSYAWSLPTTETELAIKARAIDRAGNVQLVPFATPVHVYQVPPDSAITAPTTGSRLRGTSFTITGTAIDLGLGVQNVEISTDGGTTWNAATGTTSWSYTWTLPADGTYTLVSRATNTVGYIQNVFTPVTVIVDNTPPVTTISSKPALYSNTASPTFVFTANETVTFQCRLDGASWSTCPATTTYSGLSEGLHSLKVSAVDLAGNIDPAPQIYSWTVDTIKPVITAFTPADNTAATSITTPVTVTFSEAIDPATITSSTITVEYQSGTGYAIAMPGTLGYDPATKTVTFAATPKFSYANTYTVTVTTGVKDLAGNPIPSPLVWTFGTDPDGDINLDGKVDITDAIVCLKHIVSGDTLNAAQFRHGNVAPLSYGKPNPNGKIDIGDVVVILERIVGISTW